MGRIAILHTRFAIGGAESLCFHLLEALQDDHEVHLYGLGDPDIQYYNNVFGTAVENVTVHSPTEPDLSLNGIRRLISVLTGGRIGSEGALQIASLYSIFGDEWEEYDLRIVTHGELPLTTPAIQYIHHPFLNRWNGSGEFTIHSTVGKNINKMLTRYLGATPEKIARTHLLTNSEWTAEQIETIYGEHPEVVYPPVATGTFDPLPWNQRENGIVTVGRISPDKQTLKVCKISERLRDAGNEIHLHIVGPKGDDPEYVESIQKYENENDWITLEGRVERKELVKLLERHRWAVHSKPYEHFGIVVAEYVAAGMIPFVPNSGGQVEIVNEKNNLCYNSIEEAVASISTLIQSPEKAESIRNSLPDIDENFGAERFKREISTRVRKTISEK